MSEKAWITSFTEANRNSCKHYLQKRCSWECVFITAVAFIGITVKILKFGTPQTVAIIVLEIEKFDVTLH